MNIVLNKPIREEDIDVANAVEMTFLCQAFNCLPKAGGLLDQDSYHIWVMGLVAEAQTERQKLDAKRREKN